MPPFDRTGLAPLADYDLGTEVLVYSVDLPGAGTVRHELVWELASPAPGDPLTARVCLTRFDTGRVLLWGEFADGDRCWIREDDDVARAFAALNADLLAVR